MSFLTIEDVNSTLSKFGDINTFHTIDTSSVIANQGKTYVDFCEIELDDSNDYNYTVKVFNQLWTGGCYLLDANNNPIIVPIVYNDGELTFTTSVNNVKLILYLCNLASEFHFEQQTVKTNLKSLYYLKEQTDNPTFIIEGLSGEMIMSDYLTFKFGGEEISGLIKKGVVDYYLANGIIEVNYHDNTFYYRATQTKQVLPLTIQDTLIVGKVNTVNIDYPSDLDLTVGTAIVKYKNTEFEIDLTEKTFELDLTEKTSDTPVTIYLKVNETDDLIEYEYKFKLPCKYYEVDTFEAFKSELENPLGSRIINLTSNLINFDSRILINHDVKLLCNFNILILNGHGFDLKEGVNSIIKQGEFRNGDTVFFQEENSKLELFECTFSKSTSIQYNQLGSVVFCDIDIENLQYDFDFITNINDCIFINNHSAILHGGQLNINNSKFHNTNINLVDNSNPAFLYQVDGNARLTNNVFDIDYDSDRYCSIRKNIGFAQCVLVVGETAIVNGLSHFELEENKELPFFDVNYNNRSHVFCKYYYSHINACVYSSPLPSKEDKAVCYAVSGNNWVFKQGVAVSRVDAGTENRNRIIEW